MLADRSMPRCEGEYRLGVSREKLWSKPQQATQRAVEVRVLVRLADSGRRPWLVYV